MPEKEEEEDFKCGTCSLSVFKRRTTAKKELEKEKEEEIVEEWDEKQPDHIPRVDWREGNGVMGGWDCVVNGDCEHLKNGEERSWSVFAFSSSLALRVSTLFLFRRGLHGMAWRPRSHLSPVSSLYVTPVRAKPSDLRQVFRHDGLAVLRQEKPIPQ